MKKKLLIFNPRSIQSQKEYTYSFAFFIHSKSLAFLRKIRIFTILSFIPFPLVMSVIKSIMRYLLMNIAIILTITGTFFVIQDVLGINVGIYGGYQELFLYSAVVGFTGSIISLFLSKWIVKSTYNIQIFNEKPEDPKYGLIWNVVKTISDRHGIVMPEVGVYDDPEPNAFATGSSKNSSLVAVSTGLVDLMNEKEIEGVIGHEMAHIINGDMVTITLMQGLINTFVIFASHVISRIVDAALRKNDDNEGAGQFVYYTVYYILNTVFSLLGMIVLMAYSRRREFAADAGSALYVGTEKMISALRKLLNRQTQKEFVSDEYTVFKIAGGKSRASLFSSHPDLEERIARLENPGMMY